MKQIALALCLAMLLPGCEFVSNATGFDNRKASLTSVPQPMVPAPAPSATPVLTESPATEKQPAAPTPQEAPKRVVFARVSPAMKQWVETPPPEPRMVITPRGADRSPVLPMSPAMKQWIRSSPPEKKPQIRMMIGENERQ